LQDQSSSSASNSSSGVTSDGLTIELDYRLVRPMPELALSLGTYSETHVKCFEALIHSVSGVLGALALAGTTRCHLPALPLLPERYYVAYSRSGAKGPAVGCRADGPDRRNPHPS